jgi:hypothetical protein
MTVLNILSSRTASYRKVLLAVEKQTEPIDMSFARDLCEDRGVDVDALSAELNLFLKLKLTDAPLIVVQNVDESDGLEGSRKLCKE